MSYILSEIHDIETALFEVKKRDLYNSGLRIFKSLNFPVIPLITSINQDINSFIYFSLDKKILFSINEHDFLKKITSVSLLFSLKSEMLFSTHSHTKKHFFDEILFVAIGLDSSKRDRSFNAHTITKIINKIYEHPVVILFFHDDYILFSGLIYENIDQEHSGEVFLSDWFCFSEINYESILSICCLSFGNHCQHNIRDFYYDLIFSVSREYYIYPESYEFLTYACLTNELEDIISHDEMAHSIKGFAVDKSQYYYNLYGDDYVSNEEKIDLHLSEEDELLLMLEEENTLIELEIEDEELDEESNESVSTLKEYDSSLFDDPLKIIDWLNSEDNEE